ncbi:hypothetical protein GCM10028772_25660 [Nocardioides ultimimeridianus]
MLAALPPEEELLWTGRPDPSRIFTTADIFLIPFSLLWGGFALFWNIAVNVGGAPIFFRLFGLPFLVAGAYITVGRFVVKAARKRRTVYALTDQRALVLTGSGTVTSAYLGSRPQVTSKIRADGSGDVLFDAAAAGWGRRPYQNTGWELGGTPSGVNFFDVPDARTVARLIDAQIPRR